MRVANWEVVPDSCGVTRHAIFCRMESSSNMECPHARLVEITRLADRCQSPVGLLNVRICKFLWLPKRNAPTEIFVKLSENLAAGRLLPLPVVWHQSIEELAPAGQGAPWFQADDPLLGFLKTL